MNRERSESERQLLNDVLRDDGTRQVALEAFRRARLVRRAARTGATVAVAMVVTAGVLIWRQHDVSTNNRIASGKTALTDSRDARESVTQRDLPTLTDEELIASFPSNSCFLAEVDGRQILVFTDPAVEQQVLHPASSGFGKAHQTH